MLEITTQKHSCIHTKSNKYNSKVEAKPSEALYAAEQDYHLAQ